jgi:hypothetical protein
MYRSFLGHRNHDPTRLAVLSDPHPPLARPRAGVGQEDGEAMNRKELIRAIAQVDQIISKARAGNAAMEILIRAILGTAATHGDIDIICALFSGLTELATADLEKAS